MKLWKLTSKVALPCFLLVMSFNASGTPELAALVTNAIESNDTETMTVLLSELNPKAYTVCQTESPACEEYSAYVSNLSEALGVAE